MQSVSPINNSHWTDCENGPFNEDGSLFFSLMTQEVTESGRMDNRNRKEVQKFDSVLSDLNEE